MNTLHNLKISKQMRKLFFVLIFITVIFTSLRFTSKNSEPISTESKELNNSTKEELNNQIEGVKKIINSNSKYNKEIAFFIDMKIPSGRNRFFIYDLKNNQIIDEGLVAHGVGSETGIQGELNFSNEGNSLCTSLGKYSIGHYYNGRFGKAYKLYGLDKTNSNAFNRSIVLHKYSAVPYDEQEKYICKSFGCPMVNEKYFERIEKIIDNSKTNIILNIYY